MITKVRQKMEKIKDEKKFPENQRYLKVLKNRDKVVISQLTGFSYNYINKIISGTRKMPETVRYAIEAIEESRTFMEQLYEKKKDQS